MGKQLRLGFAMGGGVSLGAYSGAALTEVIKLALLRGKHESVVVDVFSGASAGAMSLLLMLRALIAPDPEMIPEAESTLRELYGSELDGIDRNSRKWKQLVAAQHAQDLQYKAWVKGVSLEMLLGRVGDVPPLEESPAIFSRAALEKLAGELLDFEGTLELNKAGLLADRVVFACALTNLTAVMHNARANNEQKIQHDDNGNAALLDALTSNCHREVRVFDLWVKEGLVPGPDQRPDRWYRFQNGEKKQGFAGNLRARRAWSTMGATCLAAGAFPFAFEPVVLKRRSYEYGDALWEQFDSRILPVERGPYYDEISMTYVDGGVLNNEPIREAYRMASFIDSSLDPESFERQIVFVDPRVGEAKPALNVPVHTLFGDKVGRPIRRGSLARLLPHTGSLLGAFLNEAAVNEADKIAQTRDVLKDRDNARAILADALCAEGDEIKPDVVESLVTRCKAMLEGNKTEVEFPPGQLSLAHELKRVIREDKAGRNELGTLEPLVDDYCAKDAAFRKQAPHRALWLRALVNVHVDLLMDVEGKRDRHPPIAIAPFERKGNTLIPQPLPGHELSGFAGFTSETSRHHQVEMARFHAERELKEAKLIARATRIEPTWTEERDNAYFQEANRKLGMLKARVKEMATRYLDSWWKSLGVKWFVLNKALDEALVVKRETRTIEFRIKAPAKCSLRYGNGQFEYHNAGGDIPWLVARIDVQKTFDKKWRWQPMGGGHTAEELVIHHGNSFNFRTYCRIQMPDETQLEKLRDRVHPVFYIAITEDDHRADGPVGRERWVIENFQPRSLEDTLLENLETEPGARSEARTGPRAPAAEGEEELV